MRFIKPLFLLTLTFLISSSLQAESSKNYGIIVGDAVRVRSGTTLKTVVVSYLYKANPVTVLKKVRGQSYKGNKTWYKIKSPYFYGEGYVHSLFVYKGNKAKRYKKNFNINSLDSKLKKRFTRREIRKIKSFHRDFSRLNNEKDFARVYKQSESIKTIVSKVLDKEYQKSKSENRNLKIAWLYNLLPPFQLRFVAEGTVATFSRMYGPLLEKAKKTSGNNDEKFMKFLIASYGGYESFWGAWFLQTWDYGGRSLLGAGHHYKLLNKSDALLSRSKLFKKEIQKVRESMVRDIIQAIAYSEPKSAALKELKKIITNIKLSKVNRSKLAARLKEFENPPKKKKIQFNCKKARCDEGG